MKSKYYTLSVYGALLFALTGVVWGVAIESKMILFDGAYSFISVGLSLLSLSGAAYIQKQDEKRFPFGKEVIEPIIIIVKSIVILLLCLSAIVSAVYDLANGGSDVQPGYALGYAALSTIGCFVVVIFLSRQSGNKQSGFVEAEKKAVDDGYTIGWIFNSYSVNLYELCRGSSLYRSSHGLACLDLLFEHAVNDVTRKP